MITDEELILYYYRDGLTPEERTRIGVALGEQPELAQRLHRLVARLDAAANAPEVPVPRAVMQRWRTALRQAAANQTTATAQPHRRQFRPQWLAAAAVLVVAIAAVIQFRDEPATQPPVAATPSTPDQSSTEASAYERGLRTHLARTERQLASLESATPEERARLVELIIEQNRMYALAADKAGEPQLARVLRAFTPILEDLQKGGDASESVDQLTFELRVMQGRLGAAPASAPPTTTL